MASLVAHLDSCMFEYRHATLKHKRLFPSVFDFVIQMRLLDLTREDVV